MQGSVNVKLRPIKIAFLVNPSDRKAVLEAIHLSSLLWGGIYNPIIPAARRVPASWKRNDRFVNLRTNAKKIALGYIDTFDPDYCLPLGGLDVGHLGLDKERIITAKDLLGNIESDGTPGYGVGIFELLNHFIDEELKFVRRRPLAIQLPRIVRSSRLFLASVFGELPKELDHSLRTNFREALGAKEDSLGVEQYADLLSPATVFVRRLSSLYVDARPSGGSRHDGACLFLLDAENPCDVIDYWNLRAIGWRVIPIARQVAMSGSVKRLATRFIDENFGHSRHNKDFVFNTTIMKARSIAEGEAERFVESLNLPKPVNPREVKVTLQHWYPRMWDEWARDKDGVGGCDLEAGEADFEFTDADARVSAKTVDPPFISRFGGIGNARFANILTFRVYGGKELAAQVIPAGNGLDLVRAVGGWERDAWRFSRRELVYLSQHSKWSINVSVPAATDVFSAWMKSSGVPIELSPPGKIANQMIRRLDGLHGLSVLSHESVLSLLRKMESGRVVSRDEFVAELGRAANAGRMLADRGRIAQWLLKTGMIRLGAEFQCEACQQRSWYALDDLDYRLQCHNCLESFDTPTASPEKIQWAYRAFGPFNLPGRAYGVYSVLLVVRFFGQLLLDRPITPMLSFLAKRGNNNVEVDLGMFFRETKFGLSDTRLIFAECKSYKDEFNAAEIEKMAWLGAKFPGCVLVFATLRQRLTEAEKKLIRGLARKGRREWKTEQPYNPVLILTSTELLSDWGPPECWKDAGDFYKPFAEQYQHSWRELIPLCDVTQQMYLGLEPWSQWQQERWERMKSRRRPAL